MSWLTKYNSKFFDLHDQLTYHKLKTYICSSEFNLIIFHGPAGSGKKSVIKSCLESTFNYTFNKTNKTLENTNDYISINVSNNIIEIFLKEFITYDRSFINYLKSLLQVHTFDSNLNLSTKIILIYNFHRLDSSCFSFFSHFTETRYVSYFKFIMVTSNLSRVFKLVDKSVCVRNNFPNIGKIKLFMNKIIESEQIDIDSYLYEEISQLQNISYIILKLQSHHLEICDDLNCLFNQIVQHIFNKANIKIIRDLIYNILINNFDNSYIIKELYFRISKKIDSCFLHSLIRITTYFEHSVNLCERSIYHIEAYIQHILLILENKTVNWNMLHHL